MYFLHYRTSSSTEYIVSTRGPMNSLAVTLVCIQISFSLKASLPRVIQYITIIETFISTSIYESRASWNGQNISQYLLIP